MTEGFHRVGHVLRNRDQHGLGPSYRVDPRHAQPSDQVVVENPPSGNWLSVRVERFLEMLDWRIGADL